MSFHRVLFYLALQLQHFLDIIIVFASCEWLSSNQFFTSNNNNNIEISNVYTDRKTGTSLTRRPGFNKLLQDAGLTFNGSIWVIDKSKQPQFERIYCKQTSRFARNTDVNHIINALRQNGVGVYFVVGGIDTMVDQNDLQLKLLQVFDEYESKDRSNKIKFGLQESAKRGTIRVNPKILGYDYDKENNRLIINPEQAKTVQFIFEQYAQGIGSRKLIRMLIDNDYRRSDGQPFLNTSTQQIMDIVKNEKYCGLNNHNRYDVSPVFSTRKTSKLRPIGEYNCTPSDKITPIISAELFQKCQSILATRSGINRGINRVIAGFSGLLYCGLCGGKLYRDREHYYCSNKKFNTVNACKAKNIKEEKLVEYLQLLTDELPNLMQNHYNDISLRLEAKRLDLLRKIDLDSVSEIQSLQKEIELLTNRISNLFNQFGDSVDNDLLMVIDSNKKTRQELELKLSQLMAGNDHINQQIAKVDNALLLAENFLSNGKSITYKQVFDNIESITVNACNYENPLTHRFKNDFFDWKFNLGFKF